MENKNLTYDIFSHNKTFYNYCDCVVFSILGYLFIYDI